MIGRADIEGSKSNVAMNAWLPQASYPCGNFSDTSVHTTHASKGSIGHDFSVCIRTGNQNQVSLYPFVLHEISVLIELPLGHLRYCLTDVPPQPNSPPDYVSNLGRTRAAPECHESRRRWRGLPYSFNKQENDRGSGISRAPCGSHLCYTLYVLSQSRTRVKLNRVFFPR